jgi:crossover junction endodeoxyribonuclease RusA
MSQISFTVYDKAEPQGSMRGFNTRVGIRLTSDNKKLKLYRHNITQIARMEMSKANLLEPMAAKHVPVEVWMEFTFVRPPSVSKRRLWPTVKPDIDKLERAVFDALKGVVFADDCQPVLVHKKKCYGPVEQIYISARIVTEAG